MDIVSEKCVSMYRVKENLASGAKEQRGKHTMKTEMPSLSPGQSSFRHMQEELVFTVKLVVFHSKVSGELRMPCPVAGTSKLVIN